MARFLFTTAVALLSAAATFPALAQKLQPAQSDISFTTKQMGVPLDGHFKQFDAQVSLDPRKPEAGKIGFSIATASATLGAPETDAELPKPNWFGVAKFPQATFQSSAIKGLGGGKFEVKGKLNIKGQTLDVVIPVTVTQAGGNSVATGAFGIKRLDFKVGEGEWADTSMVANEVQVKFKLSFSGMAPL